MEGLRNHWSLYISIKIEEELPNILQVDERRYCIYGDSRYDRRWFMQVQFRSDVLNSAQSSFNLAVSKVRVTVEWIFKEVKMYFQTVEFKREMKVRQALLGALYICSMLIFNFRNAIYPNHVSQYLDFHLSLLEDYAYHK